MLADIPAPPAPSASALLTGAGLCLLLGGALLVWGRRLARVSLTLVAGGAGAAGARVIFHDLPSKSCWVIAVAVAGLAGLLAFALARLFWAVLLAITLGGLAIAAFGALSAGAIDDPPAWSADEQPTLAAWGAALREYLLGWLSALWRYHATAVVVTLAAPFLIGMALGVYFPQAMTILACCLLGAAGAVSGITLVLWSSRPAWAGVWVRSTYLPALSAGLLTAAGLFLQVRAELKKRARRGADEEAEAEPEKSQPKSRKTGGKSDRDVEQ